MYDESISICGEDGDEEEYELLAGQKRAGVSPVRRAPFAQQQYPHQKLQRPSRSFVRQTRDLQRSEEDDEEDSLGIMSADEEGSPAPPVAQQEDPNRKKSLSSKDFTPPPQQRKGSEGGAKHENLISLASNFAKKMVSSGSDKTKEKPPPDVAEATRREQKTPHPPPEPRKNPQEQQPSSSKGHPQPPQHHPQQQQPQQQQQQKSAQPQQPRTGEEDDEDDEDDDDYDDMNMAQIEGLLNKVDNRPPPSAYKGGARFIPRPPPGSPPQHNNMQHRRPPSSRNPMDRGAAGEPYSVRQMPSSPPPPPSQFQPGFGPATSNLMTYTRGGVRGGPLSDEDTSPEISISEGDIDLTRMEELMDMYTGNPATNPRAMMTMPIPTAELSNLAMVDEEVMENILVHRKMWEYDLDLKREALRRRTLVISDFPGVHAPGNEMYNPQDYEHLNVSPEIKELFHYITRYEPPIIGSQMDLKLKPFIPEYYPSVGDIDAFIKVIHPEVQDDTLGIKCLDEPSPFQSDPSVLDLRLRALAKQSSSKSVVVKKIDNVGKNSKVIENWIKDISDLHRSKPSPSVHYSKPMPDIDSLIQEWPPQVEDLLKNISLPSSELDCDLPTYVDIVSNLLDIPVYKSRIQSLHVLFTLYATYKHFNHYGPLGLSSAGGGGGSGGGNESVRLDDGDIDRLQIN